MNHVLVWHWVKFIVMELEIFYWAEFKKCNCMTENKFNHEKKQLKNPLQFQPEKLDRRDCQSDLYYDKDL